MNSQISRLEWNWIFIILFCICNYQNCNKTAKPIFITGDGSFYFSEELIMSETMINNENFERAHIKILKKK